MLSVVEERRNSGQVENSREVTYISLFLIVGSCRQVDAISPSFGSHHQPSPHGEREKLLYECVYVFV